MPIYTYKCDKCKRTFDVLHPIDKIGKIVNHSDITEGHQGLPERCDGKINQLIVAPGIIFKGKGFTPKFFK
jgi:predicted nucleic acid-binding Zn ribbon protein